MTEKKFTEEESRAYWRHQRGAYRAKNDRLLDEGAGKYPSLDGYEGFTYCDPLAFYRIVFPEGSLQRRWEFDSDDRDVFDGKGNAIALEFTKETKSVKTRNGREIARPVIKRHTVTDDLDKVSELVSRSADTDNFVYMAPVSWFGKHNRKCNARYLHAFVVDLDGVEDENLRDLLKQVRNGFEKDKQRHPKWVSLPCPTAIVNSGRGLHLWYVLEKPVPLLPRFIPFLQELKKRLTDVVWTEYTSQFENRQYQGIYQGFRMVGTSTRLNGGEKRAPYTATAFVYGHNAAEPRRVSLEYLVDYCGIRGRDIPKELTDLLAAGGKGRTPIAEAKEKWPEWYERRVVRGEKPGTWTNSRALYDWWLRTADEKAVYHGRYFAVMALAAFATKCGIPYEELEADAYALMPKLEDLTEDPGNHFTEVDVESALAAYGDEKAVHLTRDYISRKTMIRIEPNKRNGRKLDQHMVYLNGLRKMRRDVLGEGEYKNSGRPKKRDLIRAYAREHPDASHAEVARALGVSRTTVVKWLKDWKLDTDGLPDGAWYEDGHIHVDMTEPELWGLVEDGHDAQDAVQDAVQSAVQLDVQGDVHEKG